MRKLFSIFALAATTFAACTTDVTKDVAFDVPNTLEVSFEEGSRIQLENGKTVWTENDLVSVFFKSYENMKWQFQGDTGDRRGTLTQVSGTAGNQTMDNVVVAYPYSENYAISLATGGLDAVLPDKQSYLPDSFGVDATMMVASSEFSHFMLKNVLGWVKIQLTGDGQVVDKIVFRGNNDEQVAGLIHIDTATATATLASESSSSDSDTEVGGSLVSDDTILTEITLNCGSGVTLSSSAETFYIALPPQTFEGGFTIETICKNGTSMTKSTTDRITISRNTILPMDAIEYDGKLPEVFEIAYITNDEQPLDPYTTNGFGANYVENVYDAETGKGSLKFDGLITAIPESAFAACTNLTKMELPLGITSIGASAFNYCENLAVVNIPQGVKTIRDSAFHGCGSINEITIPNSVTYISEYAFAGCTGRAYINCEIHGFNGCGFTEVVIGDGVTTIRDYAFYSSTNLTTVTIPESVTYIGHAAFRDCGSLENINIPNSVTVIEGYAFYRCSGLTSSITIPDGVEMIGDFTFYECSNLENINIPNSVTAIGRYAFAACSSLTSITLSDGVEMIGDYTFAGCSSLESVNIPSSVTEIGSSAFSNCSSLSCIVIPNKVLSIADNTFSGCSSLTDITIGSRVSTIGERAFAHCSSLESITLPNSVSEINGNIFLDCSSLKEFNGKFASDDKRCLIVDGVFSSFAPAGLTEYTIPDGVTSIGSSAFSGCSSLTSVTIPDNVTEIGNFAFYYCDNLESLYCKPTTPPTLYNSLGIPYDCYIYVPESEDGSIIEAYKSAEYWRYAEYIKEYDYSSWLEYATGSYYPIFIDKDGNPIILSGVKMENKENSNVYRLCDWLTTGSILKFKWDTNTNAVDVVGLSDTGLKPSVFGEDYLTCSTNAYVCDVLTYYNEMRGQNVTWEDLKSQYGDIIQSVYDPTNNTFTFVLCYVFPEDNIILDNSFWSETYTLDSNASQSSASQPVLRKVSSERIELKDINISTSHKAFPIVR